MLDHLDRHCRNFIALSPFCVLSSAGAHGGDGCLSAGRSARVRSADQIKGATAIDLDLLLNGGSRKGDRALQPLDRIIIPLQALSVTVAGAVRAPGSFPFVPERDAAYYVRLAGGRDPQLSSSAGLTLLDARGREKERGAPVLPEDQVVVPSASVGAVNRFLPLATFLFQLFTFVLSAIG